MELGFGEVPGELLLLRASCSQGKSHCNIHHGNKLGKEEALSQDTPLQARNGAQGVWLKR